MENGVHDAERLKELQALPLERKIQITQTRIMEWVYRWKDKAYVSFSGGKDSTVLLDLARRAFPNIPAIFVNTGLEYPEIQEFVKKTDNVSILRPKMMFRDVLVTYGYPLIGKEVAEAIYYARRIIGDGERERTAQRKQLESLGKREIENQSLENWRRRCLMGQGSFTGASMFNKRKWLPVAEELPINVSHYCCNVMKKQPMKQYERDLRVHPILGTMTSESRMRKQAWIRHGCNAFESSHPTSQPMSFWTEQDVMDYLSRTGIPYCSVYGEIVQDETKCFHCTGCQRTGCMFCAFGFHLEKGETRFQRLAVTHPKQYSYCIEGGEWADNPAYNPTVGKEPDEMGWVNWNPKKIWIPSHKGLGMGKVFDLMNDVYGNDFYRYK